MLPLLLAFESCDGDTGAMKTGWPAVESVLGMGFFPQTGHDTRAWALTLGHAGTRVEIRVMSGPSISAANGTVLADI